MYVTGPENYYTHLGYFIPILLLLGKIFLCVYLTNVVVESSS